MCSVIAYIRRNWQIATTLGVSLCLRLLFSMDNNKSLFVDITSYDAYALRILEKGYLSISAYHPPLYPSFLAAVYGMFRHDFIVVYLLQSALGTANTGLIYLIARNTFSKKTGILGAAASLLYWPLTLYSGILLSETVFIFLLLAGVLLFLKGLDTDHWGFFIACSLAMALSALTRSINLLFLFILPALYLLLNIRKNQLWRLIRNALLYIVVFCLVLTPWITRNFIQYKSFIPVDTLGGVNLYIGNNPRANGFFVDISADPLNDLGKNDYESDRILKKAAVSYMIAHPVRTAVLTAWRGLLFILFDFGELDWVLTRYMEENILFSSRILALLFQLSNIVFVVMGLYSLPALLKNRKGMLLVGFILYYFCLTSLFYVQSRYRLPVMPFLAIGCAFTWEKIESKYIL